MKNMILISVMLALAACSNKTPDLKSPCVGAEESPCVKRAPANQG